MIQKLLCLMSFTFFFGYGAIAAPIKISLKEFVVALKPDKNPEKMQEEKQKLEIFLAAQLGIPVKVIVPLSSAVILEGLKNGSVDLGYLGSLDMLIAQKQNAATVLLAGQIKGKSSYESFWLVKKESTYKSIADLKNKPVAFASRTSTSGYLIPHKSLIEKKLLAKQKPPEDFFGAGNTWYGSGYATAVQRVLEGTAEAAAVSDYVFLENKHLDLKQKSQLRILEKQGPVPTHVLALRQSISRADANLIAEALLQMNHSSRVDLRDQLFTTKLIRVDEDKHLASLKKAIALTGADIETK